MDHSFLLSLLVCVPASFGVLSLQSSSQQQALAISVCGVFTTALIAFFAVYKTFSEGPVFGFYQWLSLDALSAYNLVVLLLIFCLSSLYALSYFGEELREDLFTLNQAKLFAALWCAALAAMILVLVSNNLGIMWVGIEATTLATAFLINVHVTRGSLEAMWKYMLICSVGIAFAFIGTLLLRLAARDLPFDPNQVLLWTNLRPNAASLDPILTKAAFIFALVGYGTKAGLSPMHSWLPDAHSKAPAPVSAVFSGFMLNTALYCVTRYVPLVDAATGRTGWPLKLLIGFGLLSIIVASAFILRQKDLKRLLAYHSVEHLGIISLGFGLGGLGTFAALFHTLNHSLCKTLSFFAAGRLGQIFGTHDMERMSGSFRASPVWGLGIFGSLLALIGVAPFCLFMSELQILKAAVDGNQIAVIVVFLVGTGAVFIGALEHAISLAWGESATPRLPGNATKLEVFLVAAPILALLVLGLWMPPPLKSALLQASAVIQNSSQNMVAQLMLQGKL
jgi:hydrogenase-4 component F